jgi:hypothetical protein
LPKLFDRLETLVFGTVNQIFGETILATWVSVDTLASYTGSVLFSNPTHKETMDQIEYVEADPYFEYLAPAFAGLKFRADKSQNEIVNISGADYYVTAVSQLSDGNTFKAYVQLVTSAYGPVSS